MFNFKLIAMIRRYSIQRAQAEARSGKKKQLARSLPHNSAESADQVRGRSESGRADISVFVLKTHLLDPGVAAQRAPAATSERGPFT